MKKIKSFLIIGGDSRQLYMADYLESLGYAVSIYGLPEENRKCTKDVKALISENDAVILPLPVSKDGKFVFSLVPMKETVDDIISCLNENHIVFGGMFNKGTETKISKKGVKFYDYFRREDVTVMNTVPTVQGILKVIIDNIDYTIHSSKCAVFGYGRVGRITADILKSLGADVTVCARKYGDTAVAACKGIKGCFINDFNRIAGEFDIIINTVPAIVINRNIIERLSKNCLIIDVASAPFGTDFAAAAELGIKALQCSSLPGKVAPKTAGKIISDGILNILREEDYG